MADLFYKGVPANGTEAVFEFKELLVSAGWTVESSSDGTTYNASGDQLSVYTDLQNSRAWFRISAPDGRELLFQRHTSVNYLWRVLFSRSAGFTGGSPNATTVPEATDQQFVAGGGTAASPSWANILNTTDGSYRFRAMANNAAPYDFWAAGVPSGGGTHNAGWFMDRLTNLVAGDADSTLIMFDDGAVFERTTFCFSVGTAPWAFVASATPSTWVRMPGMWYENDNTVCVPSGMNTNPVTSEDAPWPIVVGRRSVISDGGYKGVCESLRYTDVHRTDGDTLSVDSTRDRIVFGDISFRWDGSVPAV